MTKHEGMSNDKMTERILTPLRHFELRASFLIRHSDFVIKRSILNLLLTSLERFQRFTLVVVLST